MFAFTNLTIFDMVVVGVVPEVTMLKSVYRTSSALVLGREVSFIIISSNNYGSIKLIASFPENIFTEM